MANIKEMYDDIVILADVLEENGIDTFEFPNGISEEEIKAWEERYGIRLPQSYKEFLTLSNGFRKQGEEIFSLDRISKIEIPEMLKGYYAIGSYIGDGSMLLSDDKGNFYYGDHVSGVESATFEEFVEHWIIDGMKEDLKDNGFEIPANLNTGGI